MPKNVLMSWSSGKDSAWALYQLQQDPAVHVSGLFCTVNREFSRVAMHGVRIELLHLQAQRLGLPLEIIELPFPCSNQQYELLMGEFAESTQQRGIEAFAFGDLYLEDIRRYREDNLADTGIEPMFPIWGTPTQALAEEMISAGLKTILSCVDPRQAPPELAGREFDLRLLQELPAAVDPCGENGEFHSFAYAGPMFSQPIDVTVGRIIERDGFIFADLSAESQ